MKVPALDLEKMVQSSSSEENEDEDSMGENGDDYVDHGANMP